MAKKKEETKTEKTIIATVAGNQAVDVRSGRTTEDQNVVGILNPGDKVEVVKDGKLWCRLANGFYVERHYLVF